MTETVAPPPNQAATPCGPDCVWAQTLRASEPGWFWCARPEAKACIAREDQPCRNYRSAARLPGSR